MEGRAASNARAGNERGGTMIGRILIACALAAVFAGSTAGAARAQSRPSISAIDAAQDRLTAAICAKADADGDTYRPFVCTPRCDCTQGLGVPSSCQQTSPGTYQLGFSTLPGTCSSSVCSNSSFQVCSTGFPCQIAGEVCSGTIIQACRRPCTTSAQCPPRPSGIALLEGVSPADSPNVVTCNVCSVVTEINSNDALQCIAEVEAVVSCP